MTSKATGGLLPLKSTSAIHKFQHVWHLANLPIALPRIASHTRAYGIVLGILLLTYTSLMMLHIYEFCRSALRRLQPAETQPIAISSNDSTR